MDDKELYEIVTSYLHTEFEIPPEELRQDANLFDDLGLDSIDALDLVARMEMELKISIIEEELKSVITIKDVVNYIKQHMPPDNSTDEP